MPARPRVVAMVGALAAAGAALAVAAPQAQAAQVRPITPAAVSMVLARPALPSDYNGDGIEDVTITAPWDGYDGHSYTPGGVHVIYGPAGASVLANQFLSPKASSLDVPKAGLLGVSIASGDFDGDGYGDLAMGAPSYDCSDSAPNCGAVIVVYGTSHGLDPEASPQRQVWTQNSPGVLGTAEEGDGLGVSMAAGDFDADGYLDLAAGVDGESLTAGEENQGAVMVLYGSSKGLTASGDETWSQDSPGIKNAAEAGDYAARSLAAGDFDGDGADDLAMGVAGEAIGSVRRAGAVNIIYGKVGYGLTSIGDKFVSQDTPGVSGGAEKDDSFGAALAAGDTDGDGRDELVIGVPEESFADSWRDGVVVVVPGTASGLDLASSVTWTTPGIGATASNGAFGSALALGDVDGDGDDELAAGAPLATEYGYVFVLQGTPTGLTKDQAWVVVGDDLRSADLAPGAFGAALWLGQADDVPGADLLVGDPSAASRYSGKLVTGGVAHLFTSDGVGFDPTRQTQFDEGQPGMSGVPEKGDRFGNGFPGSSWPW